MHSRSRAPSARPSLSRATHVALALIAAAAACSSEPLERPADEALSPVSSPEPQAVASPRRLPRGAAPVFREDARPLAPEAPHRVTAPSQQLLYFGGSVISNVNIVAVNWGPNVPIAISGSIGAFYTAITNSAYFDWLSEYDTTGVRAVDGSLGTSQRIGRGTFAGSVTIIPSNSSKHISDTDIEAEIALQLAAGKLPKPVTDAEGKVNSLYMFDFPADVTITLWNAGASATGCFQFGAYHSTVRVGNLSIPYGVHPNCGGSFAGATVTHSHEMIEAVTDPEIGLVDPDLPKGETRPSAWYSFIGGVDNGESADLCEGSGSATVAGYTVATIWSNSQGACIATAPTIICDGSTPATPGCRACTAADNGVACNGERGLCETDPANEKFGQCVVCTQSSTCPASQPTCKKSSDSADDTCVSTAACASAADCAGATPICDSGSHACRPCAPADCSGATPACETLPGNINFGRCVACTESLTTACTGATPTCDTFTNKCVACMFNSDCGASAPVCTFPAHTCVACTTNAECAAGGGVCATGATDPEKGHCVQCLTSADCESPATCANDHCADSTDGGADAAADAEADASADSGADTGTPPGLDAGEDSSAPGPDGAPPADAGGADANDAGGPPADASSHVDASSPSDASSPGDATTPAADSGADGSTVADAAAPMGGDDGGSTTDSGSEDDGSVGGGGGTSSGCSCTTGPGSTSSNNGALAALGLGIVLLAKRRRRR